MKFRSLLLCTSLLLTITAGCAAPSDEDIEDDTNALTGDTEGAGFVYFHGMSKLGFARSALTAQVGAAGLLAPSYTDAQIQGEVQKNVLEFIEGHPESLVSGYSLGRIPAIRLMSAFTKTPGKGMKRVVLVDPTFDSTQDLGRKNGGGFAKAWLDADPERTFLFVYGDVTKETGGDTSYVEALSKHPRADLCFIPGDHARFRQADMAKALVADDCKALKTALGTK